MSWRRPGIGTTKLRQWVQRLAGAGLGLLWFPSAVFAQSSLQVPIQFDFLNPGARSIAMGGAFVGLADDATAALVNPAGLVSLSRMEVAIEGRYHFNEQPFLVGGRLSGSVTGRFQDTVAGPAFRNIKDAGFGLNFASFVFQPLPLRRKSSSPADVSAGATPPTRPLRIALFRHELIRVDQEFQADGVFQNRGFDTRDTGVAATRSIKIDSYGTAVALETPHVWIGGGVQVQVFSMGFEFDRFVHPIDFYQAPDPAQSVFHFSQSGSDVGVGAVFGAILPFASTKVGVSYRLGPRFDFESFSGGIVGTQQRTVATFKAPDVIAVGLSHVFSNSLLVSAEYTRPLYAQLKADYVDVLVGQGESAPRKDRFTIANGDEFHVGAEYTLPVGAIGRQPSIRGGIWHDPDHSVHYAPTAANDLLDERLVASLSSGRSLWHYTAGGMFVIKPKIVLSGGVDLSSRTTIASGSLIIHF